MINIIVAVANGGAIGRRGDLLFHISDDLRRFKSITMGHPVIMGRRTFESLPSGPLPGRLNVVVSRTPGYCPAGVAVKGSLTEAVSEALATDNDIFVIGGGQLYREAITSADRIYLTEIDAEVNDADTYFPDIDPSLWHSAETGEWISDPRAKVNYRFICLVRK